MDKALEIIMVAMILVIASVVIIAMLQGRTGDFSDYTQNQTDDSSCGLSELKYERALNCGPGTTETPAASQIESNNGQCAWAQANPDGSNYC